MPYARVGAIRCVLPSQERVRRRWAEALHAFIRQNDAIADRLLAQTTAEALPGTARQRLLRLRAALGEHTARIARLFGSAGIAPTPVASIDAAHDAGQTVPGEGKTDAYLPQLHRDWAWDREGSTENREALRCVEAALDVGSLPRKILVLGAGGCRLSVDLHRAARAELTVALDINPLPYLVVAELAAGRELDLYELPTSPRTSEAAVVERTLRCEGGMPETFFPVFGDALDPPVVAGGFDTLFTPWFIDQVPKDLRQVIRVASRVLPIGGQWINHGPLLYHPDHTMYAHRFAQDEVLALVEAAGFEVEHVLWERLLYMQSPAGSQGRTEGVLTFRARKRSGALPVQRERPEPAWLTDPDVSIPKLAGLAEYSAPHPMFATVASLIDGQRSARDIAEILVERHGLPAEAALGGVATCVREIADAVGGV